MKKGYIDEAYTSVYKNNKNIVVISNNGLSNPIFYVLKHDFEISEYLKQIVEKPNDSTSSYDETEYPGDEVLVDTVAVVVDSTAY